MLAFVQNAAADYSRKTLDVSHTRARRRILGHPIIILSPAGALPLSGWLETIIRSTWGLLYLCPIVILFGRDGNQETNMGVLLRMVTATTLSRASADLWSHTDAIHGCLTLLTATFKKTPNLIVSHHNHIAPLFHLGVEALKLPEEGTVRGAGHFLASFINLSRDPNGGCLQPVVAHNSETLVRTLMFCICNSPRHSLTSFSDVLSALCKMYGDDLARTFKTVQADETFLSPRVNAQQKDDFAKKVLKNRGSKRRILEAVTDLALIGRGLAGTDYGAQTRGFH
ncbi:hypothetical protein SK128_019341 [Halocaridina rubra]|uniref:Uncharacterized protein n=1 Tax=Halocaridina rubra TaxID=373956 RepID=A0AAN8WWS1_HALRR